MGNIIQERLGVIIGSLVVAFLLAAGSAFISIAVAGEKIEQLEAKDRVQDEAIEEGLDKIDDKLEKIMDAVQDQRADAAKFHHDHSR